jgi:adenylate cyclase
LTDERVERRLAAILAADVVGYSRLVSADEADALTRLATLRRKIIEPNITGHSGRLFKIMGDGFLAEFGSAVQAVTCAVAIQTETEAAASGFDETQKMRLRIGIHVGDVMVEGEDLMGDGVNIASRLESVAAAGGISISRAVHDQVRDRIKITFDDNGEVTLKNIVRPVHVFAVADAMSAVSVKTTPPALALRDKPSIAVLPFQNMSGDPEQEYFADGVVEDIITALSRFKGLFVMARNSSFTFKGKSADIKQVGQQLGVRYVLEGSVRKAGGRVRITGQLIDAATGDHIWADKFDGDLQDIFNLQDQVTVRVVGAIAPMIEQSEIERTKRKLAISLGAYDLFLRGRACAYHGELRQALQYYYQAIERDPEFAVAHGSAVSILCSLQTGLAVPLAPEETQNALRLANRAVKIGGDDAVVLAKAAHALVYFGREYDRGWAMVEHAVNLNPNHSEVWQARGWIAVILGDGERAIESFSNDVRISPLDPFKAGAWLGIAWACFLLGRYDEGCRWATNAMQARDDAIFLCAFIFNAALAGRMDDARAAAARLSSTVPAFRASHADEIFHIRDAGLGVKVKDALRVAGIPE